MYRIRHFFNLSDNAFNEALFLYVRRLWGPVVEIKLHPYINEIRVSMKSANDSIFVDVNSFSLSLDGGHFHPYDRNNLFEGIRQCLV